MLRFCVLVLRFPYKHTTQKPINDHSNSNALQLAFLERLLGLSPEGRHPEKRCDGHGMTVLPWLVIF